jgi:hypothetical protein
MVKTKGDLFHQELNGFLDEVKNNGIAAIAYAVDEEERLRLLAFMQGITRREIELKNRLKEFINEMEVQIVKDEGDGVDIDILEHSGGVIQTIEAND